MAHKPSRNMSLYDLDMQRLKTEAELKTGVVVVPPGKYSGKSFNDLYLPIASSVESAFTTRINNFWAERIQLEKTMQYEAMLEAARQKRFKSLSIEDSYLLPDIAPDKLSLLDKLFGKRSTK